MFRFLRKNTNNEDEGGYWISFSDLMSGTLIIFILLFIYKLVDYQEDYMLLL